MGSVGFFVLGVYEDVVQVYGHFQLAVFFVIFFGRNRSLTSFLFTMDTVLTNATSSLMVDTACNTGSLLEIPIHIYTLDIRPHLTNSASNSTLCQPGNLLKWSSTLSTVCDMNSRTGSLTLHYIYFYLHGCTRYIPDRLLKASRSPPCLDTRRRKRSWKTPTNIPKAASPQNQPQRETTSNEA